MKKIRVMRLVLEEPLKPGEISSFRGAVIRKVGEDVDVFHNHRDSEGFYYRFPLIQYKIIQGKAALFCVEEGLEEVYRLFEGRQKNLVMNGKKIRLKLDKLSISTFTFNVWNRKFRYNIFNWLALNQKNFLLFHTLENENDKKNFLGRILVGNILSMAKTLNWHIDKAVEAEIQSIIREKKVRFKGIPFLAYDVSFTTNVSLPEYIGLGKGASHGFGIIRNVRNVKNSSESLSTEVHE